MALQVGFSSCRKKNSWQCCPIGQSVRGAASDANGSTTGSVIGAGTYGLAYNGRNQLSLAQLNGSTVGTYTYNALGQRIGKVTTTAERYGYNENGQLLAEYDATNRDYLWMDDVPVAVVDNTINGSVTTSTVNYITADQLNTPRAVTSSAGTVIWQWAYAGNPFGEQQPTSAAGYVLNLRYPGQYFDAETGLISNGMRDCYEPATGRYCQSDPTGLVGGISTYTYGLNNPLMYVDPLGLQAQPNPGAPAPGPAPAPSTGPAVPDYGPPANDPVMEPEAPGIGGAIAACASNPIVCGAAMLILPTDAGGPQDETVPGRDSPNVLPFPKAEKKPCPPDAGNGCEQDQERLMELYKNKLQLITNTPGLNVFAIRGITVSYNAQAMAHNERCPSFPVPLLDVPRPFGMHTS
jgi:RHS repeat-associated protein